MMANLREEFPLDGNDDTIREGYMAETIHALLDVLSLFSSGQFSCEPMSTDACGMHGGYDRSLSECPHTTAQRVMHSDPKAGE